MTGAAPLFAPARSDVVLECQMGEGLPGPFYHLGDRGMRFEGAVFDWMRRLSPDYRGTIWHFYELSNGGFYMAPNRGPYRLVIDSNGYEAIVSADAAGITMCLYACSHLSFHDPKGDIFGERFHQLRDYALGHPESVEIFSAID